MYTVLPVRRTHVPRTDHRAGHTVVTPLRQSPHSVSDLRASVPIFFILPPSYIFGNMPWAKHYWGHLTKDVGCQLLRPWPPTFLFFISNVERLENKRQGWKVKGILLYYRSCFLTQTPFESWWLINVLKNIVRPSCTAASDSAITTCSWIWMAFPVSLTRFQKKISLHVERVCVKGNELYLLTYNCVLE